MKLSSLFPRFKLNYHNPLEEAEFHKIKQPLLQDFLTYLLKCGIFSMLPLAIRYFVCHYYFRGTITVVMLFLAISISFGKKFMKKSLEYIVLGYLMIVTILIIINLKQSAFSLEDNQSFYIGYSFAMFHRTLGYRVVKLHSMIVFQLVSIALRFSLLPQNDVFVTLISVIIEVFTLCLSFQSEKGERALFDSLYKSKEELTKLKDFLIEHIPHQMIIFDSAYSSTLLINDSFKSSFKCNDLYGAKCALKNLLIDNNFIQDNHTLFSEISSTGNENDKNSKPQSLSELVWLVSHNIAFLRKMKVLRFRVYKPKDSVYDIRCPSFKEKEENSEEDALRISNASHVKTPLDSIKARKKRDTTILNDSDLENRTLADSILRSNTYSKIPVFQEEAKSQRKRSENEKIAVIANEIIEVKVFLLKWDGEEAIAVMLDGTSQKDTPGSVNQGLVDVMSSPVIKTPLLNMLSTMSVMQKKCSDLSVLPDLNVCESYGKILLNLVTSLTEAAQVKQQRQKRSNLKFGCAQVSIKNLIEEISSVFRPLCKNKDLFFNVEMDSNIPESIICNKVQLSLILTNLLASSIGVTFEGGITLSVLSENQARQQLRFIIQDTSKGIVKADQKTLSRILKEGDLYVKSRVGDKGMYLNLIVSNVLLNSLENTNDEGGIQFQSEVSKGSIFSFAIPYHTNEFPVDKQTAKYISIIDIATEIAEDCQGADEDGTPSNNKEASNIIGRNGSCFIVRNARGTNLTFPHQKKEFSKSASSVTSNTEITLKVPERKLGSEKFVANPSKSYVSKNNLNISL